MSEQTSFVKRDQKAASGGPLSDQKDTFAASSVYHKSSKIAAPECDGSNKRSGSKMEQVKGWARSARQWTIFGESTKPKQERYAFYT